MGWRQLASSEQNRRVPMKFSGGKIKKEYRDQKSYAANIYGETLQQAEGSRCKGETG
jgi:hypothetical protein